MKKAAVILLIFLSQSTPTFAVKDFFLRLSDAALELTQERVEYDPSYYRIAFPNGDIPKGKGVCTDVIIRAYRKLGIDLQKEVHTDMRENFTKYPKNWGRKSPDSNIDHRRVPNLMTFFTRFGVVKPKSKNPNDYLTGDIVCWDLGRGITHIGIVVDKKQNGIPLIVHNIGRGQVLENSLFQFKIIGHYLYRK
jgi:uncharacterized protein